MSSTWPHVPAHAIQLLRGLLALNYSERAVARWARTKYASLAGVPILMVGRAIRRRAN